MIESRRGPKRSEAARTAIFAATLELLRTDGYDRLSIEAIARQAGVGKQTIYRWWPSKAAVIVDAVLDGYIRTPPLPRLNGGDLAEDLHRWLHEVRETVGTPMAAALAQALTTAATADAAAAGALYDRFTGPLRQQLYERLRDAPEVRPDADHLAAADAMIGAFVFVLLSRKTIESAQVTGLLDVILHGIRRPPG